jgi:hypothetical protein
MHTTFIFVLSVYYVYNYMFLHFFKTYKMYKIHKIHKPLPVSGFHRPIIIDIMKKNITVTTIYNHVTKRKRNHTNRETTRQQAKREVMKY